MIEWRKVPGSVGYEISNDGQLRSYRRKNSSELAVTPILLKPRKLGSKNYVAYVIGGKNRKAHILVLLAFVGERPKGMVGRHLDDNHLNNHISNLAWGTRKENGRDCVLNDRLPQRKLTESQAQEVIDAIPVWKRGMATEFSVKFGVKRETISHIRHRRTWTHLS